ncbi:MAG TPA: glutamate-1-semialdehyde 2,1-aminomutase [Mycobacteriales bacterium]|nr:glutamate-1-semialdehyde 2,1-aminomutase [Mycobacteriales bacterium]
MRAIPGGAHTYAKGDDQYPEHLAPVLVRGSGSHVWDADGNEYLEYGMGLRAVTLGHAHSGVVAAVRDELPNGSNFTRPTRLEAETAEDFLGLIPTADMVKFAKNGSDVTTAAVRLARAATGRDLIAVCVDQPFFSTDDWFIGSTAMTAGIPKTVRDLTMTFPYNDLGALTRLFAENPGRIAAVILEPASTHNEPDEEFLPGLRGLCTENGAVLIFDEMITGFRFHLRGAQAQFGVTPDLSTFGKALGNGFSVSALAGRRELMELGGFPEESARVFLLSTTHGAEGHSLAAARAVMATYQAEDVIETMYRQGRRLAAGVRSAIDERGLGWHVRLAGRPCNLIFETRDEIGERSQAYRTLFLQELLKRGVIAPSFVVSAAHSDADIDRTIEVVDEILGVYAAALNDGLDRHLESRPVRPALRAFS